MIYSKLKKKKHQHRKIEQQSIRKDPFFEFPNDDLLDNYDHLKDRR